MSITVLNNGSLPETIRAAVLRKPRTLEVTEVPLWPIESYNDTDLVLIKVKSCGICGSDLRYFMGENPWAQHTLGKYVPNPPNIVPGHEFAGDVVAVIDERNKDILGKRVVPISWKPCEKCIYCRTERQHLCPNTIHAGHGQGWGDLDYYPGAYCEYVPAWGKKCYEIPKNITYDEASMMDVLTVCTRVANRGEIKQGAPILIMGCGPAGNGIAQIVRFLGAGKVIVTGRSDITLNLAREQKFDVIIDTKDKTDAQVRDMVMRETDGYGCATVFDSIGTEASFKLSLSVLDKGGIFVNMAVREDIISFSGMDISAERNITTSSNARIHDYPATLSWLANGKLEVSSWISNITLEEVPETFQGLIDKKKARQYFKVVINP